MIDAGDFLRDPEAHLRWLCDWLGIPFTDRMLSWPAGPRDSDGVWAPYWYDAVWRSTGFEPWRPREVSLSEHDAPSRRPAGRRTTPCTPCACGSDAELSARCGALAPRGADNSVALRTGPVLNVS